MIPIEAVRAAALSDQPWTRLDALVRAEMAAGRRVADIASELTPMADDVWDTPGLSEDGHDAFGDTLDALTGNCRSEDCYCDPPRHDLPTDEETAKLPQRARVAFAARCARRVLPLLQAGGESPHPGSRLLIEAAVLFAEERAVSQGESRREMDRRFPNLLHQLNGIAAEATTSAVVASVKAAVGEAYRVVGVFIAPAYATMAFEAGDLRPSIRRDYDHLARLAAYHKWTDDTPVPPEVFGPLWPDGPPPGWPADPDVPARAELPVAFLALGRVLPVVLEDEAVNLFNALNRYHIARTGQRLRLDGDIHTMIAALVGAGV